MVEAVGEGVDQELIGERVWVWEAAWQRPWGTAAEYTVVPVRQAVRLGDASFELGACLGIPFLTAHRCLTSGEYLPDTLRPGALSDHTVLVQGGAGAVGNAAVQLASWADACVIATVSSAEKAQLAAAAGASLVVNYREQDVVEEVHKIAPDGVHGIVEVSPARNAATDVRLLRPGGVVSVYANDGGDEVTLPVGPLMAPNARWQFVLVYTMPKAAKAQALVDVAAAAAQGGIRVGEEAGLPLHSYPLSRPPPLIRRWRTRWSAGCCSALTNKRLDLGVFAVRRTEANKSRNTGIAGRPARNGRPRRGANAGAAHRREVCSGHYSQWR